MAWSLLKACESSPQYWDTPQITGFGTKWVVGEDTLKRARLFSGETLKLCLL